MSLPHRIVYNASSMSHPQLFDDSRTESVLFDIDMSTMLGSFHQLIYVTSYIIETMDNLIQLSEDIHDRIQIISRRSQALIEKLPSFESRIMSIELYEYGHSGQLAKEKFLSQRESYIPTVLSRNSNSLQIMAQYEFCQPLPTFWKLVPVTQQDTTVFYSNPSFFFREWLKEEQKRQFKIKQEQKKQKFIKKQLKAEKKKRKLLLKTLAQYEKKGIRASVSPSQSKQLKQEQQSIEESKKETFSFSPTDGKKEDNLHTIAETAKDRQELAARLAKKSTRFPISPITAIISGIRKSRKIPLETFDSDDDDEEEEEDGKNNRNNGNKNRDDNYDEGEEDDGATEVRSGISKHSMTPTGKEMYPDSMDHGEFSLRQGVDGENRLLKSTNTNTTPAFKQRRPYSTKQPNQGFNDDDKMLAVEYINMPNAPKGLNKHSNRPQNQYSSKPNIRLNATNISSHHAKLSDQIPQILQQSEHTNHHESSRRNSYSGGKKLLNSLFGSIDEPENAFGMNMEMNRRTGTVKDNIRRVSIVLTKSLAGNTIPTIDTIDLVGNASKDRSAKTISRAFNFDPLLPKTFDLEELIQYSSSSAAMASSSSPKRPESDSLKRKSGKEKQSGALTSATSSTKAKAIIMISSNSDDDDEPSDEPPPPDDDDDLPPPPDDDFDDEHDDDLPNEPPPPSSSSSSIPKYVPPVMPLNLSILSQIKQGAELKRAPPPPPPKVDFRNVMLSAIKTGVVELKKVEIVTKRKESEQNVAIAAILANRSKIAGSDSDDDDDDSDSNFSDDDYG